MRVTVRSQGIGCTELASAITQGIREAQREAGRVKASRTAEDLKAADVVVGGAICKNIDKLIGEEGTLIQNLFSSYTPANIKAARTEIARLIAYLHYARRCRRGEA